MILHVQLTWPIPLHHTTSYMWYTCVCTLLYMYILYIPSIINISMHNYFMSHGMFKFIQLAALVSKYMYRF